MDTWDERHIGQVDDDYLDDVFFGSNDSGPDRQKPWNLERAIGRGLPFADKASWMVIALEADSFEPSGASLDEQTPLLFLKREDGTIHEERIMSGTTGTIRLIKIQDRRHS